MLLLQFSTSTEDHYAKEGTRNNFTQLNMILLCIYEQRWTEEEHAHTIFNERMNETKNESENIGCDQAKRKKKKNTEFIYDSDFRFWIVNVFYINVSCSGKCSEYFNRVTTETTCSERINLHRDQNKHDTWQVWIRYLTPFVAHISEKEDFFMCEVFWCENVLFYFNLVIEMSYFFHSGCDV